MRSVILTTSSGYAPEIPKQFERNLRNVGFSGDVEFFDVSNDPIPLCTMRLFDYLAFLRKHPSQYDTVILSDLRDVVFQDNPEKIPHGELDCFLEWEGMTIGRCPFNRAWIEQGFGAAELQKIVDKPISCAGFTIGSQSGIDRYLDMILEVVQRTRQFFPGADQGIHNWLIHSGLLPCQLHKNEDGPVYTVGYQPGILVRNHRVINAQGLEPIVVHQWDRHVEKL